MPLVGNMSNNAWSNTKRIAYSKPDPFAVPVTYDKNRNSPWLGADVYQRETLHYSAEAIEEIMFQIDDEYRRREMSVAQWKRYKSSISDFSLFTPASTGGNNVRSIPVKWFPQIVKDIQARIETLISDVNVPDSLSSYLARIYQNYTISNPGGNYFNSYNILPETINVPGSSLLPKQRARDGLWPFSSDYVDRARSFIGIDASGVLHAKSGPRGIETTAPGWPQSPISKVVAGKVAGVANDVPMASTNRPIRTTQNAGNTSLGVGAGKTDFDQGYGYFGHPALVVQQLRYQPPVVEWWPSTAAYNHYVRAVYSNTTPNLAYYFGQPVEKVWTQNWGNWILFGHIGIAKESFDMTQLDALRFPPNINGNIIRSINAVRLATTQDPMATEQGRALCPYNVFYPAPTGHCSCHAEVTAGIIWWAYEYSSFEWDSMALWQLQGRGSMKPFGPNTRMRISLRADSVGSNFAIGIKTAVLGTLDKDWTWLFKYPDVDAEFDAGYKVLDFNIMQRLNEREPGGYRYSATSIDSLMAVYIYSKDASSAEWICAAADGPGGSYLPASCFTPRCTIQDTDIFIGPIELYEPAIT